MTLWEQVAVSELENESRNSEITKGESQSLVVHTAPLHVGVYDLRLHRQGALFVHVLTFRHRASCILGQAFHYSPENAFYIFNQQIYFII